MGYTIDEAALRLAEMMDGKLLVVPNVRDMANDKVIERYKSLADIERGFNVLKSELELGRCTTACPNGFARMPQSVLWR